MTDQFTDRIDVHFHYLSPEYREKMIDAVGGSPDGFAAPQWSAEGALAMMDRMNIATGMLSVSSPGVHFGNDAKARLLARSVNEFAARTMGDHRGRVGGFASLPLPDIDGALEEIAYAFDTLKLDGVVMLTNFNGVYLGDKRLDPVFDELNRRGAVVFIHPTSPICWQQSALGYPRPMIEFTFDSTRAVVNLIFSGTTTRCPKVRFIVPHAGGTLPFLARRIGMFARGLAGSAPVAAEEHLRKLYYDLAGSPGSNALAPLLEMTDRSHILYGSDYVHTPEAVVSAQLAELLSSKLLSAEDFRAIARGNALTLFPRLA
jgi:predicted TIM-barrel fold metal-dependent hydrolase